MVLPTFYILAEEMAAYAKSVIAWGRGHGCVSGVYLLRLTAGGHRDGARMVLLKWPIADTIRRFPDTVIFHH
ncbi:MAG: hypothetical protein KAY32_16045 [Candidatus Eisenbacteria sp.]|nr:hypothetical protein [Candidatus Eisenbacteria bacterium]